MLAGPHCPASLSPTCVSLDDADDHAGDGHDHRQRDARRDPRLSSVWYYLVPHITSTHHLHGVVLILRDALGGAELGPVPVSAVVAPPPPLAHQHVPGVAVKLDLATRGLSWQLPNTCKLPWFPA